jgi:hypothetical protein
MPDSYGKRQRRDVNQKKAVAREERRVARAQRKKDREAGLIEAGTPIGPAEQAEWLGDDVEPAEGEIEPGAQPAQ